MRKSELELALGSLALGLQPGTVLREICPECGGGRSREKSLSIGLSEEGYLWWKCHRASCELSGKKLAWGVVQGQGGTPKKAPKGFSGALEALSDEQRGLLKGTFGLDAPQTWRYATEYSRLYLPVSSATWRHRGAILRSLPGDERKPKTLTFKEKTEEPWMHWTGGDHNCPVIVEDMFSAAKVAQAGIPAVCLMGTHLGMDKIRELCAHTDVAHLALDKDAYGKALKYSVDYRHLIGLKVWKLEIDLKYESEERIKGAYYDGETNLGRGDEIPQGFRGNLLKDHN